MISEFQIVHMKPELERKNKYFRSRFPISDNDVHDTTSILEKLNIKQYDDKLYMMYRVFKAELIQVLLY